MPARSRMHDTRERSDCDRQGRVGPQGSMVFLLKNKIKTTVVARTNERFIRRLLFLPHDLLGFQGEKDATPTRFPARSQNSTRQITASRHSAPLVTPPRALTPHDASVNLQL